MAPMDRKVAVWLAIVSAALSLQWSPSVPASETAVIYDGTAIGDLAESMSPGQWAELTTTGANAAFSATDSIFEYCDKVVWDPVQKQVLFYGTSDPATGSGDRKFIRYLAATNTWDILPQPSFASNIQHSYKHHAIDLQNRRLYYRPMGSNSRSFYSISLDNVTGSWRREPEISSPNYVDGAVALAYFPARNTVLLHSGSVNGSLAGLAEFNPTTGNWSNISENLSPGGGLHAFLECSPVLDVCIFGGGDDAQSLWMIRPDGTISNLGSQAPFGNWSTRYANTTVDPVSGNFLVISRNNEFYEFNPLSGGNGSWSLIDSGSAVPPLSGYDGSHATFHMSSTPVSNYGVVMYVQWRNDGSRVWLYKHSPSEPVVRPARITDLAVN